MVIDALEDAVTRDPCYAQTTNLVVMHDGEVLLERHFGDDSPKELADVYSVTKSVVSTLVGIALGRGELVSLDLPVHGGRTYRHLLAMTGGTENGGPWEIDEVLTLQCEWRKHIEAAPRLEPPGTSFRYDNAAVHVLGCAFSDVVGSSLADYAQEHLFSPLEIDKFEWPSDPEGYSWGFGHLRLRPRDLARIGELWRRGGEGIVPADFVADATREQSPGGPPEGEAYGYLWWVTEDSFFAGGYAGQALVVVPEERLVVAATAVEERLRPGWRNPRHALGEALWRQRHQTHRRLT
jgi:CubicO group peptidase (beta-lactamase class C family)